jgi:parallel beta-helix repeat protein
LNPADGLSFVGSTKSACHQIREKDKTAGASRPHKKEKGKEMKTKSTWLTVRSKRIAQPRHLRRSLVTGAATLALLLSVSNLFADTHYVSLESTNPVPPYTSWDTAATNIQHAVDTSIVGDTVLVNDGVYAVGERETFYSSGYSLGCSRVVVLKAVSLKSVNGPQFTVIDGGGNVRCIILNAGASLSGFILTNGAAGLDSRNYGGGVMCASTNAFLTNCVLTGNYSSDYGGGACYGTLYNCTLANNRDYGAGGGAAFSTLIDCTLTGNEAFGSAGGAWGSTLINCLVTSNTASYWGSVGGCTLNNCVIAGNSASDYGGGMYGGDANNCTITGNSALFGGGAIWGTLTNCTLTGNSAGGDGGGAFECDLYNCRLGDNQAGGGWTWSVADYLPGNGGGAYGSYLYNCVLAGNTANGVWQSKGQDNVYAPGAGGGACSSTLYNCTLIDNFCTDFGGGVSGSEVFNTFLFFNKVSGLGTGNHDETSMLNHCCTAPLPDSGIGNILLRKHDKKSVFLDYAAGDLRLQPGSPCINAGSNDTVTTLTDANGNPRIIGGTVDIGAYEFQGQPY